MKKIVHFIQYILFICFVRLFQFFGLNISRKIIKCIATIIFYLIPIRKKIVEKNLRIAFPNLTKSEIEKLALKSYISIGYTFVEFFIFETLSEEKIRNLIYFNNSQLVEDIIKSKKAAILLTAHFGNWELGAISFPVLFNLKLSVLYKKMHNPYVTEWLIKVRNRFNNSVAVGLSLKEIIYELKQNKVVGIVADQRAPKDSTIQVNFFNTGITSFSGPASLAVKFNIPIYFVISNRNEDYTYNCDIMPIEYNQDVSDSEKIIQITQKYYTLLENYIKKYPEQWFWLHNRWKHINI